MLAILLVRCYPKRGDTGDLPLRHAVNPSMGARGLLPAGHGLRGKSPVSPLGFSRFLLGGVASCWKKEVRTGTGREAGLGHRALPGAIVQGIRIPNSKRGYGYLPSETVKNRDVFSETTGMYLRRVSEGRYPCRRVRMAPVFKDYKQCSRSLLRSDYGLLDRFPVSPFLAYSVTL